jgi:hypothetical protein
MNAKARARSVSADIALTAALSAALTGGKLALSWLPNVEIVTVLLTVFTCTLGLRRALLSALVFCALDMLLYPFSPGTAAAYFVYWPLSVVLIWTVNRKSGRIQEAGRVTAGEGTSAPSAVPRHRGEYVNAFAAAGCTALFGVITTAADTLTAGVPFAARYAAGFLFFAVHTVSNFLIVLFAFKPLTMAVEKLR